MADMLATIDDVQARIGGDLDEEQTSRVDSLIEEASVLVEAYLDQPVPWPVPRAVTVVVSRMVARVLQAPAPSFAVDTLTQTAGQFSQSKKFTTGASGGAPWLTAQDKTVLNRFRRRRRGFYSISMV